METVLYRLEGFPSSESHANFLKKDYVLTNVTDSLATEYHFLQFFQTAVEVGKKMVEHFPARFLFSGNPASFFSV